MFVLGFVVGAYSQVSSIGIILQLQHLYVMGFWSVTVLEGLLILLSTVVLEIVVAIMTISLENEGENSREIRDEAGRPFTRGWLIGSAFLSTISFFLLDCNGGCWMARLS
jgi:mannose/fructose/N-acetylgalactosamine-specific phosphotransferase system component IIC